LIDNGEALDVIGFHQRDKLREGRLRRHGEDALCHHVPNLAPMRLHIFFRQPPWANEERNPSGMPLLCAGLGAAKQVALRDDAEQCAIAGRHGQAADAVLQHQQGRVLVASGLTVTTNDVIRSAAFMAGLLASCKNYPAIAGWH
jgi:hypothetical protein